MVGNSFRWPLLSLATQKFKYQNICFLIWHVIKYHCLISQRYIWFDSPKKPPPMLLSQQGCWCRPRARDRPCTQRGDRLPNKTANSCLQTSTFRSGFLLCFRCRPPLFLDYRLYLLRYLRVQRSFTPVRDYTLLFHFTLLLGLQPTIWCVSRILGEILHLSDI